MARVATFVPDLLFGSRVLAAVTAGGHEPRPVADAGSLAAAVAEVDGLVLDLTVEPAERIDAVREAFASAGAAVPVLAFYSHVEVDVRERALAAGFALVVPRSRMAREGTALVGRLLGESGGRPADA